MTARETTKTSLGEIPPIQQTDQHHQIYGPMQNHFVLRSGHAENNMMDDAEITDPGEDLLTDEVNFSQGAAEEDIREETVVSEDAVSDPGDDEAPGNKEAPSDDDPRLNAHHKTGDLQKDSPMMLLVNREFIMFSIKYTQLFQMYLILRCHPSYMYMYHG